MTDDPFRRGYQVRLEAAAETEMAAILTRIAADSPEAAQDWLDGFNRLTGMLADFNINFGYARENGTVSRELRQVVHHSHRIVYAIDDDHRLGQVLHIWHGKREKIPRGLL